MGPQILLEELASPDYDGLSVEGIIEALTSATHTRPRSASARDLLAIADFEELNALSDAAKEWLKLAVTIQTDFNDPSIKPILDAMFPPESKTGAAYAELATEPCSRADIIGLASVKPGQVEWALQKLGKPKRALNLSDHGLDPENPDDAEAIAEIERRASEATGDRSGKE